MGCGSCGTGVNGKPSGCKSNGGCSSGGCNRMNVYDWLNGMPLFDGAKPFPIIVVSFNKGSRKEFYRNNTHHILSKNDWVTVEGVGGYDIGQISLTGELVKLQLKKYSLYEQAVVKRILHPSTAEELQQNTLQKEREAELLIRARAIARGLNLEMKLCEVEVQSDSKKGTFFYTADQRVDFRELIKLFANDFKMKVEMRQIGARQESGKVGGIGSCGRELCCSTWLTDFKSVNTTAARYQNLSINQTKLSGQCGRLKCCLNYELDTYMDALSVFPEHAEILELVKGNATLQKRDIFKNLMWYSFSDNNKQYPLTITRVKEIQKLNKAGQKADDLQPIEIETRESKTNIVRESAFINDVGQVSLKSLEKGNKKKKPNSPNPNNNKQPQQISEAKVATNQTTNKQQNNNRQAQQNPKPNGEQRANLDTKPNVNQNQQGKQNPNQPAKQNPNQQPKQNGNQQPKQNVNPNQEIKPKEGQQQPANQQKNRESGQNQQRRRPQHNNQNNKVPQNQEKKTETKPEE